MIAFIQYPSWISPEIIPGFPIRWYGLMYLCAFITAFFLFRKQTIEKNLSWNTDAITNLFTWSILGLLLGARIFAALVYDKSGKYWHNPLLIFWPFDEHFKFIGFQGMSYHGALIGTVTGFILFCKKYKFSIPQTGDMIATAVPFGYFFGRIGNFINGELYGRVTSSPIGIVFPYAEKFSIKKQWVADIAEKTGINIPPTGIVNLPRHPSQLYEAFFEGIFLGILMWFVFRKMKLKEGTKIGIYLTGYGIIRFFIEYLREPDPDIGFILKLSGKNNPVYLLNSLLDFSIGQLLCSAMIIAGLFLIWFFNRKRAAKK